MATTITYKGSDLTSFSNTSKTLRTAGKYLEGDITISASTVLGTTTVVPSETTQTISPASGQEGLSSVTVNGITSTYVGSDVPRPGSSGIRTGITNGYYKISLSTGYYPLVGKSLGLENKTVIPSETEQVKRPSSDDYYLESVTVAAITPTYVGSSVPAGSLTVSGPTVTASAGYYANAATATVPSATLHSPLNYTSAQSPTVTVDSSGLVTATVKTARGDGYRIVVIPGYISSSAYVNITSPASTTTYQLDTQAATTITPSSATQTITGQKYMTGNITIQPIPSQYIVPSGTLTITSVDTTTTFNATNYASVTVNLKNADVTAY